MWLYMLCRERMIMQTVMIGKTQHAAQHTKADPTQPPLKAVKTQQGSAV